MKRCARIVLLALIPLVGCNRPSPTTGAPPPVLSGETKPAQSDPTRNWRVYTAKDGSYAVKFPGDPTEDSQSPSDASGTYHTVIASCVTKDQTRTYSSSSMHFAVDPAMSTEKGLDEVRDAEAGQLNAAVTAEKSISFKGIPGREISMSVPNGNRVKGRIYLVNRGKNSVGYSAQIIDLDRELVDADAAFFLNSLEIK